MQTKFTKQFTLRAPIALAPMAGAAGGRLAAAVAQAGGLGLIGGGYGDADWLSREWDIAGEAEVGVGFITWALRPDVLDLALSRRPKAVMLSFGDVAPFAPKIAAAGVPLICQVQTLTQARVALAEGAACLVAQGAEAGGHGDKRGTFSLVPEVADLIAGAAPEVSLLAAGGIADGRGIAAAHMLGADGVLLGTRFWATPEALVPEGFHRAAVQATGDQTLRGSVPDAARSLHWPAPYTIRTLETPVISRWQADPDALRHPDAAPAREAFLQAQTAGDAAEGAPILGEAVGLIQAIEPAGALLQRLTQEAEALLKNPF